MSATPADCPRCLRSFDCGIATGACWCGAVEMNDVTRAALAQFYDGCLCRECLQSIEEQRPQVPTVRAFLKSQLKRKYGRRR